MLLIYTLQSQFSMAENLNSLCKKYSLFLQISQTNRSIWVPNSLHLKKNIDPFACNAWHFHYIDTFNIIDTFSVKKYEAFANFLFDIDIRLASKALLYGMAKWPFAKTFYSIFIILLHCSVKMLRMGFSQSKVLSA